MMRSLYSGVSGLQSHQTKMDVVSNNIANVNTVGFKKSQTVFQDMLSQTIAAATAADTSGGRNAQQIGTGVKVGAINVITTQGAIYSTGSSTDIMIQGEGYFMVTDGNDNQFYTRAGSFTLDNEGNLVNGAGMILCDDSGDPIQIDDYSGNINIAANGTITYTDADGEPQEYGSQIGLTTFPNPAGLTKVGGSLYTVSAASGDPNDTAIPGEEGTGTLCSSALEMSNVDLSSEFVDMIVAQRGFQANSKSIQTSDEMLQELMTLKR